MKYILHTTGNFYEAFNTVTKTTVYVSEHRSRVINIINKLNTGNVSEQELK